MRVHLCRHAEAFPGDPDDLRELTNAGKQGSRRLGDELAQADRPPLIVVASPLTRARHTGEIVAERVGCQLRVRDELRPGSDLEKLRKALDGLEKMDAVAVVAHQPDCSRIMLEATGFDPGFQVSESFPFELDE